jgi:hypothetical protein
MPTLDWIGRKVVENHHQQVPFRLLKDVPELSVGDLGTGNLIGEERLRAQLITFRQTPYEVKVS